MPAGLWYVTVFCLGTGASIPLTWVILLTTGKVPEAAEGKRDIWFHILAEIVTGALLVAGGVALLLDHRDDVSRLLAALGLGALVYALTGSPGYYLDRGDRRMAMVFPLVWVFALPAIVLLFTS